MANYEQLQFPDWGNEETPVGDVLKPEDAVRQQQAGEDALARGKKGRIVNKFEL